MKEIKCPKCGTVFTVDDSDYAAIVSQVKNAEFDEEVRRRLQEVDAQQKAEQQAAQLKAETAYREKLSGKDNELTRLQAEVSSLRTRMQGMERSKQLELQTALMKQEQKAQAALAEKDRESQAALAQKDRESQEALAQKDRESQAALAQKDRESQEALARKDRESQEALAKKDSERQTALAEKDRQIGELNLQIAQNENQRRLAVMQEKEASQAALYRKDREVADLRTQMESAKASALQQQNSLKENYEGQLRQMEDQVAYLKDMKFKLTTKMVGETLEVHCNTLYNQNLRPVMPGAYFEKDNDASEGTKGDFIFRDYDDGVEYISIMFEMKNELENGGKKHKNEDFFRKLDEDRRKKGCEYAVLVTMLEPDNDLYNNGIVDVSQYYEKMYVIRPQFFIPIITLLVQTSRKAVAYKKQVAQMQQQNVDVTNFEDKLNAFKTGFMKNVESATTNFEKAIKEIDATISHLQKVRDDLITTGNQLRLANNKADDLTIRKLTYKNPTMKAKFEEARNVQKQ